MALTTPNPPPSSPWSSSSTSSQPPLPCIAFPDGSFFPFPSSTSLPFPNAAGYHGSSSDYLLFTVAEDDVSGDCYYLLVNPFTGDTVRLPSLSRIRFVVNSGMALPWRNITDDQRAPYGETTTVRKVVMCPSGEFVAAMVGDGKLGKIAMCRRRRHGDGEGSSSSRWVMSGHDVWRWFDDIAFYDGKVYAVDDAGSLFAMDTGEDKLTGEPQVAWAKVVIKVSDDSPPARRRRRKEKAAPSMRYLLVSGGKLMMVHRAAKAMSDGGGTTTTKFEVFKFKADLVSPRWLKMASVGDNVAIFVGRWFSFALRVSKYKRIHFLDDDAFRRHCCPDDKFGSYDMADNKIYPLILPPPLELCNGAGGSPATWLFPREQEGTWRDLPSDVFGLLLRRLHRREDRVHLSQVCRDWLSSTRQHLRRRPWALPPSPTTAAPPPVPGATVAHLALPNGMIFSYPELTSSPFHKNAAGSSYLAAACDDWLLFSDADGLFRFTSPTGKTMLLPSFHNVHGDDRPVEIINEPSPSHESSSTMTTGELWRNDGDETMAAKKLVICQDGIIAAIFGREHFSKLVLCSSETFSWTHSVHDRWRRYDDLAFHGGKLYAVTVSSDLLAIDVGVDAETGEPSITRVERVIEGGTLFSSFHFLVPSGAGDELLMVRRRFPYAVLRRTMLVVFRADLASSRWVEMDNLGGGHGEALFVGRMCSRSVAGFTLSVPIFRYF